jgi:hypothetical protein
MGKKRVLCGYGIDIDAVAGWLGSYGGEDSTSDISRGIFLSFWSIIEILSILNINHSLPQASLLAQSAPVVS